MEHVKLNVYPCQNTQCSKYSLKLEPLMSEFYVMLQIATVHKKSCIMNNYLPRPQVTFN